MAVMAQWNGMTWEVSSNRIAALNSVSASVKLDTENNDDKAGSPSTNTKALELQSFSFDYDLASVAGGDVLGEFEAWTSLVGEYAPFYLAGRRFGPENLQLTEVSLGSTTLNDFGEIIKGKISISLTEYAEEASSKKSSGKKKSSKKKKTSAAKSSNGVGKRLSALEVGASSTAKAAKKPNNSQLMIK